MTSLVDMKLASVRARYAEPHRHYHGVSHLETLLALFAGLRPLVADKAAVQLAIFYHDAIYRPDQADNEAESARLLRSDLAGAVDEGVLTRAETLILATKEHRIPGGCPTELAADCALFLDMDLSVLGAAPTVFDRYEADIAAEYLPFHDEAAYRQGRMAVLGGLLARDRLFLSRRFAQLEAPARTNLSRSLEALRKKANAAAPPPGAERPDEGTAVRSLASVAEAAALHPASPPHWGGEGLAKRWLTVVGIGEDGMAGLGADATSALEAAEILVGGERHLALVPPSEAERFAWDRPIDRTIAALPGWRGRRVVVLASGDPMFYGIGATLARTVPIAELTVLPAPGAISLAAARLGWPLQEAAAISLHGRPLDRLAWYLAPGARLLALTENGAAPGKIARWLAARGWGPSRLFVLERLGGAAERCVEATADAFPDMGFADLNTVAIDCRPGPDARWWPRLPGLPDEAFHHDGQLTKKAVRAATLAALAPCGRDVLWDVGAGCGSIAIEWLRALEHGQAIAIERDHTRCALITANAAALGVPDLTIVEGAAPAALADLPAPDAVFIGGGVDEALLNHCYAALKPGGRLVANVVTVDGEATLANFQRRRGGGLSRLAIAQAEALGEHQMWRAAAPVTQLLCRKDAPTPMSTR